MKTARPLLAAALVLAAGCAGHNRPPSADIRASADPWLRSKTDADCQRPSCLFAIVRDTSGAVLAGADVELSGTSAHVTSDNQGRIIMQGVTFGSHRVRVLANGETLESGPVALGYSITTLTIEVAPGGIRLIR